MRPDPAALAGCPVIIGAGLAGLVAALELAPRPVVVVSKSPLGDGAASGWSQGGLAAAVLPEDSPKLHAADTMAAGDGICDAATVRRITERGAAVVDLLERLGVRFARDATGAYACKLEAAHSRRRVLNAGGDGTGAEIMRALTAQVKGTPSVTLIERATACRLSRDSRGISGVVFSLEGQVYEIPTRAAVIATGGAGSLWRDTTNPPGALGQGLALAAEAGAALSDLEFVQFHPTALDVGRDPMPLASEAVRGDGGILLNDRAERFMTRFPRAELEPRDVVARAVWAEIAAGRRVFLDIGEAIGRAFPQRFPALARACAKAGIDPLAEGIPIRPAAHYHMGGIAVDERGRSSIDGLWACGEAACTGLHGANRLASNSLLEAVVTGQDVARDLSGLELPTPPAAGDPEESAPQSMDVPAIRGTMSDFVGVLRDRRGLELALDRLANAAGQQPRGAALTALMIAAAALRRTESRGGHFRTDFPDADPKQATSRTLTREQALAPINGLV